MDSQEKQKNSRGQAFVAFVIERMKNDTGYGAALRRADNPATEHQAWEHLAKWCDLDKPWERLPFATVAAALAKSKPTSDGTKGIGRAIAECYEDGNKSDSAKAKLRRLLACHTVDEVCTILRPLLGLVASRGVRINYAQLLDQLVYFGDGERARVLWATEFYGRRHDDSLGV